MFHLHLQQVNYSPDVTVEEQAVNSAVISEM